MPKMDPFFGSYTDLPTLQSNQQSINDNKNDPRMIPKHGFLPLNPTESTKKQTPSTRPQSLGHVPSSQDPAMSIPSRPGLTTNGKGQLPSLHFQQNRASLGIWKGEGAREGQSLRPTKPVRYFVRSSPALGLGGGNRASFGLATAHLRHSVTTTGHGPWGRPGTRLGMVSEG
jgi:hypothetical protein